MNMTVDSAEFAGTALASDDLELVHATQNSLSIYQQGRARAKAARG